MQRQTTAATYLGVSTRDSIARPLLSGGEGGELVRLGIRGHGHSARSRATSRVAGMSRIDFTPEQTTSGPMARASSSRSWGDVKRDPGPAMHAAEPACGHHADAGHAGRSGASPNGRRRVPARNLAARSRRLALRKAPGRARFSTCSASDRRESGRLARRSSPGPPPRADAAASDSRAVSRLWGQGNPWAISVDSRATTARPPREPGPLRPDRDGSRHVEKLGHGLATHQARRLRTFRPDLNRHERKSLITTGESLWIRRGRDWV